MVRSRRLSKQLLLVEDNADSRVSLAMLLGLEGWQVVSAGDGADALEQMQNGLSPAVIVTDYLMPRLDGLTMLDQIRGDPTLPHPPAVVVSALRLPPALYETKADAYFTKPLDLDQFRQTLLDLIERPPR